MQSAVTPSRGGSSNHQARALASLDRSLDRALEGMSQPKRVPSAFRTLVTELDELRTNVQNDVWIEEFTPRCRAHELAGITIQDPYTARALDKPRGFAGDAKMLDYIYGGTPEIGASAIGAALFQETALSPSGVSVRDRRDRLAERIRYVSRGSRKARVVSIACGHLREAHLLGADELARVEQLVALDQDRKALALIDGELQEPNIETVFGSVRDIIAGRVAYEGADLVYAAGLFDYLSDAVSSRLIEKMLSFLRPGGRILVGNFTPTNWGRSYMESFMDWQLTYRTVGQMRDLGRKASIGYEIALEAVSADDLGNIAYLELVRA